MKINKMKRIILASTSPRRHGLMQQIGLDFEVIPSNYEEDMTMNMFSYKLVQTLAYGKAKEVANRVKSGIVIGADTFVTLGNKKLGKPKSKEDAKNMLRMQSGKMQKIYSGIAIIDVKSGKELIAYEVTKLKMKKLTKKEIDGYVATGEPLDKAGAFALQGLGAIFVEKVDGCYSNVIGLPLHLLANKLKEFNIDIFKHKKNI